MTDRPTLRDLRVLQMDKYSRPATLADLIWVVKNQDGTVMKVQITDASYGPAPKIVQGDLMFVDMDHEIGTNLEPGCYLVLRTEED